MRKTLQEYRKVLRSLVKEQQEYEANRTGGERCGQTWVQPLTRDIILNGVPHSGVAAHVCNKRPHESGTSCECLCGKRDLIKK